MAMVPPVQEGVLPGEVHEVASEDPPRRGGQEVGLEAKGRAGRGTEDLQGGEGGKEHHQDQGPRL